MANSNAQRYGRYYWCVKTDQAPKGEIYLHADELEIVAGALVFWGGAREEGAEPTRRYVVLTIGAGAWSAAFAASCMDGHAIAVEHWEGEVL